MDSSEVCRMAHPPQQIDVFPKLAEAAGNARGVPNGPWAWEIL